MNEYIESLALQKDFAVLDAEERSLVLAEMSETTYTQLRATLLAIHRLDADIAPPAGLKNRVMDRVAPPARPMRFWKAQMPVWLGLLLISLGILMGRMQNKPKAPETATPQVLVQRDTVWLEKTVWRERLVVREKWRYRVIPETAPAPVDTVAPVAVFSSPKDAPPKVGTSLGDAPELMRFFTNGDK